MNIWESLVSTQYAGLANSRAIRKTPSRVLDEARRKYLEKTTDYTSPDGLRKNTKNFLEKYHLTVRIVNAERALKTIANVFLSGDHVSGNVQKRTFGSGFL